MKRYKYWDLKTYDKEEIKALAAKLEISPVTAGILWNRGLREENRIRDFLFGKKDTYYDPFLMKDMRLAAERILQAVEGREKIAVYGDYDVDGITASSLLYLYLTGLQANVSTYIPKREGEGYGLNNEALQYLYEEGINYGRLRHQRSKRSGGSAAGNGYYYYRPSPPAGTVAGGICYRQSQAGGLYVSVQRIVRRGCGV